MNVNVYLCHLNKGLIIIATQRSIPLNPHDDVTDKKTTMQLVIGFTATNSTVKTKPWENPWTVPIHKYLAALKKPFTQSPHHFNNITNN